MAYKSPIPYSSGAYGRPLAGSTSVPYSTNPTFGGSYSKIPRMPTLGQSGVTDMAPGDLPPYQSPPIGVDVSKGASPVAANPVADGLGSAQQAAGGLSKNLGGYLGVATAVASDAGDIANITNANAGDYVDKSYLSQGVQDTLGAFTYSDNPFKQDAGQVLGTIGGGAAKGAAAGAAFGPIGAGIGAIAGGLVGGVKSFLNGGKADEVEREQQRALQRYSVLRNQQLAYKQKESERQAAADYAASRYRNAFNY